MLCGYWLLSIQSVRDSSYIACLECVLILILMFSFNFQEAKLLNVIDLSVRPTFLNFDMATSDYDKA
ncbi:hypothetical protein C0J52_13000 [Blattella germanica]|nr:hypothetical protein C0J52_13000 [Blattella germanica]